MKELLLINFKKQLVIYFNCALSSLFQKNPTQSVAWKATDCLPSFYPVLPHHPDGVAPR
ncbi:hypothetical protein WH279_15375 [Erwinia sp. MYb375]|uniref:hypothetical protein n=1 Tax=Erwinia sp. MYb375 TaxID=2745272 RepID=UPI0030A7CC2A